MKGRHQFLILVAVGIAFLLHSPTLLDFQPEAYSIPFQPLRGPLEINDKLSHTEHLFAGSIYGPESIVVHDGALFTGTEDGKIIKIKDGKMFQVAQTGRDCNIPYEERLCGRPLGLRMGRDGLLYVLDAYYGLHTLNTSTGALTRLLSSNVLIDGQKMVFPDDLDIDERGNVYFSDASAKWDLSNIYYLLAEFEGSGRVIRYNIYTGESEVLVRNLYFPNGVQISHDGNSLLICEISRRRVLRYYLKGPKKGALEVLIDNLPGEPDNIRLSERKGYWVALATVRNDTHPLIIDVLGKFPLIRKLWARAQHGLGSIFMAIGEVFSSHVFKEFAYRVRRGDILLTVIPRHGMILELNENGEIVGNYQDPAGRTCDLSQVTEDNGYLYLGSFTNHYLGRLKL